MEVQVGSHPDKLLQLFETAVTMDAFKPPCFRVGVLFAVADMIVMVTAQIH